MDRLSDERLGELETVAKATTLQGPWEHHTYHGTFEMVQPVLFEVPKRTPFAIERDGKWYLDGHPMNVFKCAAGDWEPAPADADFIAAFDPSTAIAILSELRRARAEGQAIKDQYNEVEGAVIDLLHCMGFDTNPYDSDSYDLLSMLDDAKQHALKLRRMAEKAGVVFEGFGPLPEKAEPEA